MSFTKTSIAALTAAGFIAAAASASACDWHMQQVQASTPAADEQTETAATPIDPVILARTESREESKKIEQK